MNTDTLPGPVKALLKALKLREGHARNDRAWNQRRLALSHRMERNGIDPSRTVGIKDRKVGDAHQALDLIETQVNLVIEADNKVYREKDPDHRDMNWQNHPRERGRLWQEPDWDQACVDAWTKKAADLGDDSL